MLACPHCIHGTCEPQPDEFDRRVQVLVCVNCGRSPGPRRVLAPEDMPADSGSSMYKQHHKGIPRSEWPTQSGRHPAVETPHGHSERKTEWPMQGQSAIRSWTMHQGIGRASRKSG